MVSSNATPNSTAGQPIEMHEQTRQAAGHAVNKSLNQPANLSIQMHQANVNLASGISGRNKPDMRQVVSQVPVMNQNNFMGSANFN